MLTFYYLKPGNGLSLILKQLRPSAETCVREGSQWHNCNFWPPGKHALRANSLDT